MSTQRTPGDPSASARRPAGPEGDGAGSRVPLIQLLRDNATSVRMLLVVAGAGAFLAGVLLYLFLRDLVSAALLTMAIGLALLALSAIISWRQVGRAVFGTRGRYGANTLVLLIAFVGIAALGNYYLFWLSDRPNPPGWLRLDTTATKQFALAPQAVKILEDLKEPIRATVFMVTDTAEGAAAWRSTQDLLSEFRRRSGNTLRFELVDPELHPNTAAEYGVSQYPAIAIEGLDSRRTEVIVGGNPRTTADVFDEQSVTTALLVVNQVKQKAVYFVTGHGERDIAVAEDDPEGYSQAAVTLLRDNYRVAARTLNDLIPNIFGDNPDDFPAALIFAGPTSGFVEAEGPDDLRDELAILRGYLLKGGSVIFLLEPDPPESFQTILGEWGLTVGEGHLVDAASFVAGEPTFLQLTRSNRQIEASHAITAPIDVVYMPGATFIGRTVQEYEVDQTAAGEPYLNVVGLATTTLSSWEETGEEDKFDIEVDRAGPLPVMVAIEALAPVGFEPREVDGELIRTNMVIIGDVDFGSNRYFSSAKNGDLLANAVNWAVRDFELISIRPKVKAFRELVLTKTERDFVRWTGWLLMPAIIGTMGVWIWWRRR